MIDDYEDIVDESEISLIQERDRLEREEIKQKKIREVEDKIRQIQEEEMKQEAEIEAMDDFFNLLAKEDLNFTLTRRKPDLEDITHDITGKELTYDRNHIRKPADVKLALTPEHVKELNFCLNNPVYTIKNYVKIINQDKGLMDFNTYDYQSEFIKECLRHKRVLSCWPRQSGKCVEYSTKIKYIKIPTSFFKKLIYKFINFVSPTFFDIVIID